MNGQRVKVYFNLHKKVWSILHMTPNGWRLWGHSPRVILADVQWKVSEAGRQRVLRERRKNVHAFAIGTLLDNEHAPDGTYKDVKYSPYAGPYFCVDGKPVHASKFAFFTPDRKVFACQEGNPRWCGNYMVYGDFPGEKVMAEVS